MCARDHNLSNVRTTFRTPTGSSLFEAIEKERESLRGLMPCHYFTTIRTGGEIM
jgi:hypothetical protein